MTIAEIVSPALRCLNDTIILKAVRSHWLSPSKDDLLKAWAPIIYLAGRPGGSAIRLAKGPRGAVFIKMRTAGDVIALEQRGVGLSKPTLDCNGRSASKLQYVRVSKEQSDFEQNSQASFWLAIFREARLAGRICESLAL